MSAAYACPGCEKRISYAAPACPYCARPNSQAKTLEALRSYVGDNWEEHYRDAFIKLLRAEETGTRAGWTWNWAAALAPLWFLYRRLYIGFFMQTGVQVAASQTVSVVVLLALGMGMPLAAALALVAVLALVAIVVVGFLGDRLLFQKALAEVRAAGTPADTWRLAKRGKPLGWVVGVGIGAPVLAVAAAFLVVPDPGAVRWWAAGTEAEAEAEDVFASRPRPLVEDPRLVVSADQMSRIVVPGAWEDMRDLSENAQIQVGDDFRGLYVMVLTDGKAGLPSGLDLEGYTGRAVESIGQGLAGRTVAQLDAIPLRGMPALLHEVRGAGDGVPFVFWIATVEGARSYHRVVAWTHASEAESAAPLVRAVIGSFQETGK